LLIADLYDPGMKNLLALICILAVLAAHANAQKKVGNWDAIEAMPQGSHIWVSSESSFGSQPCIFQQASDQHLICETVLEKRLGMHPRTYALYRTTVHEVRAERYTPATGNGLKGAAIGAGIGIALGLAVGGRNGLTRGGTAVGLGGIFGLVGYGMSQVPLSRPSVVIFRR
jgi:hypothetical protein